MASGSIRRLTEQLAFGDCRSQRTSKSGAPVSGWLQPPGLKQDIVVVSRKEERGGSPFLRPKRRGHVPGRFFFVRVVRRFVPPFREQASSEENVLYFALAHARLR